MTRGNKQTKIGKIRPAGEIRHFYGRAGIRARAKINFSIRVRISFRVRNT